ncbi:UDP-N-acetylmuramoyl-tripeptide--D-alanyl-D-alanine ligase [Maribacter chungangensis]|uniref:UDP-N-acetylmuramoyl-tripeptide--D-alanyl-D-alanine ligase n=1 Tax=Maribacter chungangensis TaxID=1069117 RepID=A0ABW3B4R4_9FLAO
MKIAELHNIFLQNPSVSTDTRKINENDLFFALKGDNFNGNQYALNAIDKGAAYAIIDEEEFAVHEKTILVDDVLSTLQKLANFHRHYCSAKVISLTGSNGKTTTKELIYAVLSKEYRTIATKGNLNNHIGVPLSLLNITPDTEIAIIEMGANHQKEIEFLSSIAEPDFGYITNFGKAHLEGFGGVEGVIKGKSELYDYLLKNNKVIFMNADDPIQKEKLGQYVLKYGFSTVDSKFYTITMTTADPFVRIKVENIDIKTQLIGAYNFTNCCAAIVMGKYFNVALEQIKEGLENYLPDNNRSQVLEKNGVRIILDAYNANPSSMTAALENFANLRATTKLLFLGDMFELGDTAPEEHQAIADLAKQLGFENTYLIGENFFTVDTDCQKFKTFETLSEFLKKYTIPADATLFIKGSRGMALERIVTHI